MIAYIARHCFWLQYMLFYYYNAGGESMMPEYQRCVIKSFKHNGSLHRMWQQYWLIPAEKLLPEHAAESMLVLVARETNVQEASGKRWTSRVPAVTFFIPGQWYNIVALMENGGIRYYCNLASPVYVQQGNVLTYIDYDLDIIHYPDGSMHVVDRDEYEANKHAYHYPADVQQKVAEGLALLKGRIRGRAEPFRADAVQHYYEAWMTDISGV